MTPQAARAYPLPTISLLIARPPSHNESSEATGEKNGPKYAGNRPYGCWYRAFGPRRRLCISFTSLWAGLTAQALLVLLGYPLELILPLAGERPSKLPARLPVSTLLQLPAFDFHVLFPQLLLRLV